MLNKIHGGDIYSYNLDIMDFSANINPFGMHKNIKNAIIKSIDTCKNYPDIYCRELKVEISKHENLLSENIICGNGAADLIYRIVYGIRPKNALILAPTFAEYEEALKSVNSKIVYHYLNESDFGVNEDIIPKIKFVNMVFICNPNNPTGILTEKNILEKILHECEKYNVLLVLDECFNDFLEYPENYTLKEYITKSKNLIILKAFTKMYAMAGIRLGYALSSNVGLIEKMHKAGPPWNVSTIAQNAGIAALMERDFVEKTRELIKIEREFLIHELNKMGIITFNSRANYVFFKCNDYNLKEKLISHNILIRDCSNYPGLKNGYYRIAVKLHKENIYLVESLKRCI